jgi:hypothetical protein
MAEITFFDTFSDADDPWLLSERDKALENCRPLCSQYPTCHPTPPHIVAHGYGEDLYFSLDASGEKAGGKGCRLKTLLDWRIAQSTE